MSHVATRLLSLILLLQSRPGWKAAELARELGVSERTVHRYMAMLDEMGIPIYSERGPYGGFSLVRGYHLPPLLFSAEEATVLYMGANLVRELWGRTYHDAVTAVTAKLDNVLPDDLRREVARAQESLVIGNLQDPEQHSVETMIHLLRQCIRGRQCVRLVYRAASQEDTQRVVEPYALALQWGAWYLAARCRLRDGMRLFRVDRILQATPTQDAFTRPPQFDMRAFLHESMRYERPYLVTVQVEADMAPFVRRYHGARMQLRDCPDGTILCDMHVADYDWVVGWILSLGPSATVLWPPHLVERVRQATQTMARRYADDPDAPDEA